MSVHGTARWASWDELRDHKLLGSRTGLFLGFAYLNEHVFEPLRYSGDLHQLIVAGTGGGKFTNALAPMLLGSGFERQTVVAIDPKGEIAKLTGPFFQQAFAARPSVFLLDPWDQCGTGQTSALNVLTQITPENPNYVDDARTLADAIIIPSGSENRHWDESARNFLTALLLFVALDPSEEGRRDLIRIRDLATATWAMPKAYKGPKNRQTLSDLVMEHLASELADGAVRRGFSSIMNREERERSGILSSIERDTAWIDSPQMQRVLRGPSLDLAEVGDGGNKYYVVLPPDYFITHRGWLRLVVTAFAKAMKRYRPSHDLPQDARWRHIIIDEFANLGEMPFILADVAVARGADIKYTLAVQDLAQLDRVYGKGWESFITNTIQRFFAVGDLFTAEYVSKKLGSATVDSTSTTRGESVSKSTGFNQGTSISRGTNFGALTAPASHSGGTAINDGRTDTFGTTWSSGESISKVQRFLHTPDEVSRLPSPFQYLFVRGLHPFVCWCPPYWNVFRSLPNYTLAEVLATVGQRPANRRATAHFIDWRNRALLMQPKALPLASRLPRWRAALVLIVVLFMAAGGYAAYRVLSPSRNDEASQDEERRKQEIAQRKKLRENLQALSPTPAPDEAKPPSPQASPWQLALATYNADLRALAQQLEPHLVTRLNAVGKVVIEDVLRKYGLCQSSCAGNGDPSGIRAGILSRDDTILGRGSNRRDPVTVGGVLRYDIRQPAGNAATMQVDLTWRVRANATIVEQLNVEIDGAALTGPWKDAVQGILAGRTIDTETLRRACATGKLETQEDQAFGCYNGGRQVRLWQQWPYVNMPVTIRLPQEPKLP
jgi:type IV secretion system protein VirD4